MTATRDNGGQQAQGPAFEWWMFSFIAAGAGWSAFISLLIPPYITGATGNAADAGVVMAIISLAAVMGPVLGGFADKYRAHRLVLSAVAAGSLLGSLIGGWLASAVGYNAINWMAAIAVGGAVLLLFVGLWPAERKKVVEEQAVEGTI